MLIYDEQTLERTRRLIDSNPSVQRGWTAFESRMKERDVKWSEAARERIELLRQRWLTYGGSKRFTLGNEVRELAKETQNLAFYAGMTGSEEAEVLVRSLLKLLGEEEQWLYQSGGGRNSDLWTADIGVYLAAAYDAVRTSCSEEERAAIEDMLYRKAYLPLYEDWLHPLKKIHALDTMGHNWWIVCVSAAGLLLLTLGDRVPHAEAAMHTITESIREWFAYPGNVLQNKQANFGPDGDYIETMGYLDYALGNFLVFEAAYRRYADDPSLGDLPVLFQIPDVYLETIYWKGHVGTFHFGDDGDRKKHAYVWLRLADLRRRGELLGLFAEIKGDPGEAAEFAFYPEDLPATAPVSDEKEGITVLEHSGYGFVRWHSGGEQVVLAVKTGESWNHNHLDVGTFVLTVGGRTFVDDSGHCAYSKPLYNDYYRQSIAHNVVLLDGQGQPSALIEEGTKFPGSIPDRLDMPGYKYLLADCTGPYSGLYRRFYRHFLCLEGAIVLIDDLQAEREGAFEWVLHIPEGLKFEEGTVQPAVSIRTGEQEMKVLHPYPESKEYVKESGYLNSYHRDTGLEDVFPKADYMKIRSVSDDGRIKFVSVFMLPKAVEGGMTAVRLNDTESDGNEDIQVTRLDCPGSGHTDIFVNRQADGRVMHENSHASYSSLETDAFISTLSYDAEGRLSRISLHNGSYLKLDGRCLFSSLLKASAVLDYRGGLHAGTFLSADAWCYFSLEPPGEETAAQDEGANSDHEAERAAQESKLILDPDSGLWKMKMKAGSAGFRLVFDRP
ncbi:heparinase II/III domain-containing protein [Saccharibacillus kuerlensis]|uniref:Heparinase II/III-like C-terminal domain-containing protein n=1 Tax=Saccharibacillus kuerlensis TaxID=459527 RepID=A0ABQ2L584_9BACL|nr:heparinase II/III family protein [Saccharibacillus kuerlensis]GGO03742.1 hypothetical protein GCM10010969_28230 [Saccharibacillus kuerlensis]